MANRTIKELLQLTLESLEKTERKNVYGICYLVFSMYLHRKTITGDEYTQLDLWIDNHLPSQKYPKQPGFKWKPGTKACRIKWLTKQINSL